MADVFPMCVAGVGMLNAVGFNARATAAAVRARIAGLRRDNLWDRAGATELSVGRPRTPQWWEGPDMLAELATPVVLECLEHVPAEQSRRDVPILLLLAALDRPARPAQLEGIVVSELERRLAHRLARGSTCFSRGRTGLYQALLHAAALFRERAAKYVVVVGVDSFMRQDVVDAYAERRRLKTADNSNGFAPGEAACAVLLRPAQPDAPGELHIVGAGCGVEPGHIESDQPLSGAGLTDAMRQALAQSRFGLNDTDVWLNDQNGEHYKFKECTVAQVRLERLTRTRPRPYSVQHPIEYLGEIGAAIGPCLLGLAWAAHHGGYAVGPRSMLTLSEDGGDRAALVLSWNAPRASRREVEP